MATFGKNWAETLPSAFLRLKPLRPATSSIAISAASSFFQIPATNPAGIGRIFLEGTCKPAVKFGLEGGISGGDKREKGGAGGGPGRKGAGGQARSGKLANVDGFARPAP